MKLKRRKFLILSGLGSLGAIACGTLLRGQELGQGSVEELDHGESIDLGDLTPTPQLRFISLGDTGTGGEAQYAVAAAMAHYHQQNPYDVALLAGDNIYNSGEIEKIGKVFEEPYQPLLQQGVKFYACLGNHDVRTDNGTPQVTYPGFNMEGRYYTFRRDRVQFFALDTNHNTSHDGGEWGEQLHWLEEELSRSDAPWKIVFGHHQIYSSGRYGVDGGRVRTLTPLFKQYGVQLYINGHDHHYERTQPIDGTTYLICGIGAKLRRVGTSEWTARSVSKYGFATCEVYDDRIVVRAIDTDFRVFDWGEIPLVAS